MTNPDFPILVLTILSFIAGFAAAIWLAVALDRGAKQMAEKETAPSEETP